MFIPYPIFESIPVAVNIADKVVLQKLSIPIQAWTSIKLASNSRSGIPGGVDVTPFKGQKSLVAQGDVVDSHPPFFLQNVMRRSLQIRGKSDPTELPGVTSEQIKEGVLIRWEAIPTSRVLRRAQAVTRYKIHKSDTDPKTPDEIIAETKDQFFVDKNVVRGQMYSYNVFTKSIIPKNWESETGSPFFWGSTLIKIP